MYDTVLKLMNAGGDPDIRNQQGFSCLHIAAREGHADLVRHFVSKDSNVDLRDEYGYNAAYWAHKHKHAEVVALLPPPLKITKEDYYEHIVN